MEEELKCQQCGSQDLMFLCGPQMAVVLCKTCWAQEHRELTSDLKAAIQKKMSPVDPFREK
jgi:hypothetical protein